MLSELDVAGAVGMRLRSRDLVKGSISKYSSYVLTKPDGLQGLVEFLFWDKVAVNSIDKILEMMTLCKWAI